MRVGFPPSNRVSFWIGYEANDMEFFFSETSDAFGKATEGCSADGMYLIAFSYSYRDGISWTLRRNQPWKILFEYFDGSELCNDDPRAAYDTLLCDLRDLSEKVKVDGRDAFDQLRDITHRFMYSYFPI